MYLWHNCNKQECHTIVFRHNLWYNCDKQEYHNFPLYKGLFICNLWHKYDQYECHNITRRVRNFQLQQKHSYVPFLLETLSMTKLIWSTISIISPIIFQIRARIITISQEKVNEHVFPKSKISNKMFQERLTCMIS